MDILPLDSYSDPASVPDSIYLQKVKNELEKTLRNGKITTGIRGTFFKAGFAFTASVVLVV